MTEIDSVPYGTANAFKLSVFKKLSAATANIYLAQDDVAERTSYDHQRVE